MTAEEAAFVALMRQVSRETGLSLDTYKNKCLRRRIAVRMRACGVQTYSEYRAVLDRDPGEYERLKDAITINVTRFYRNADTWNLLRGGIIREICRARDGEIRVWSAGCSSGEEPYTLTMLIAEQLEQQGTPERLRLVTVDATDIDQGCLARAQVGRYRSDDLAELPAAWVERYFERVGNECRVRDRLRERVHVRTGDLSRDPPPRHNYHLIVCRNVVIYFGRAAQERVFATFADSLAPGGFLVLGKVETLFGPARDRLTLLDPRERVYRLSA